MIDTDSKLSLLENDYSKENLNLSERIQIRSEAFPTTVPDFIANDPYNYIQHVSEVHLILNRMSDFIPTKENIYFDNLKITHLNQIKTLHKEWFPVRYTDDYLAHFIHENENETIALGCFIQLNGKEYVIGSILCNYYKESKFNKSAAHVLKNRSCFKRFFSSYVFGYIATLGVIDEFRNLGIAKNLIEMSVEKMKNKLNCLAAYLHVIEYNKSAYSFYKKVGFEDIGTLYNFYSLYDAYFNSNVFLKILKNSNLFVDEYQYCKDENYDEESCHNMSYISQDSQSYKFYSSLYKIFYYCKNLF